MAAKLGSRDYLTRFCNKGLMSQAFQTVSLMEERRIPITRDVFFCLLQGCARKMDMEASRNLHKLMVSKGFHTLDFLAGHLVRVFALCGSLPEALEVFYGIRKPSMHSWNAIISACSSLGDHEKAVNFFKCMQANGIQPNSVTFQGVLKACIDSRSVIQGRVIHGYIIEIGLEPDTALMNTVIDMYAKCVCIDDSRVVFDGMKVLTVTSWGCMIAGLARHSEGEGALRLYRRMQQEDIKPNSIIFSSVLKGCADVKALEEGQLIHHQVFESGLQSDVVVGNTLIHMYTQCGCRDEAYYVFKKLPHHTERSWGALIGNEVTSGLPVDCLKEMQDEDLIPNRPILLNLLKSCCNKGCMNQGMLVHYELVTIGLECDPSINGCLIDMYTKCGSLWDAHKTFDMMEDRTVITWGTLISGYIMHGLEHRALELVKEMHDENIEPDVVVYLCILKASGNLGAARDGRLVHSIAIETGVSTNTLLGSTIVGFYIKSGFLEEARKVFDDIMGRDVLVWGVILAGYVQHGLCLAAIGLYIKMLEEGGIPNGVVFAHTLNACGGMGAIKEGKLIHSQIFESCLESDLLVGNSILKMYVQFGLIDDAFKVFENLSFRDIMSWSTMIEGCTLHGEHSLVHRFLEELQQQGLKPDEYVLTHMLSACVQAGHLDQGIYYLSYMREYHGVEPNEEHYSCMVDLLGRAGYLDDAKNLLYTIPFHSPFIMWTSLLTSCRAHGNPQIGMQCFDNMMQLEPFDPSGHMLMSNLLIEAGYQSDIDGVRVVDNAKMAAT